MKHKHKKLPHSQIELEVTVAGDDFQKYWDIAYEKARLEVNLKGFRPGSAPKEMTDSLIDKEKVFDEATKASIRDSLRDITQDNKWQVIDQPKIDVTDASPKGGLKFKTILTTFPEVSLGDYKKAAKKVIKDFSEKIGNITISEEEIQKSLDWLRESRASEIAVERPIQEGDLIEVDIKSDSQGKPVEGAQLDKDRFVVGKSHFVPGFDKELISHKRGETFKFSLTTPNDYWNETLRGKKIDFTVTVHGIFERKLPELNDDFARALGPDFKNVTDLKNNIKEGTKIEKQNREREKMRVSIIDEIVSVSEADLPEIMVERTLDNMVEDFKPMLEKSGKSESDAREELRDRARRNVLNNLVIHAIGGKENLAPTPEEVENEKKITPPEVLGRVDERSTYDYIYGVLLNKKVFTFLESLDT